MKVDTARLRREVRDLVRIPSWREVDTVARHTLERLRAAGVRNARRDEDGNVVGSLGRGEGLLLNAHLDTVGVEGFVGDPHAGRVAGERLLGRGASDCKSGVACMLELARLLAQRRLRRRVVFAFTVWEEGLGMGPNGAYGAARRADASEAIVMEASVQAPSRMKVYAGCRGVLRLDIHARGKACHSSRPEEGDNALYRAAEFVRRFQEVFAAATLPSKTFRVLGETLSARCVASLTEAKALQGRNIIPDRCLLGMDCRLYPGQDAGPIVRRVRALAREVGRGKIDVEVVSLIPGHLCGREGLIRACQAAAEANGFSAPVAILDGRADSTIFQNTGGIPSVVFGPGTCGVAHTRDEFLDLPLFYRGAQACLEAVLALAGDDGR